MSYEESKATCDFCTVEIGNKDTIACGECMEELKEKNDELETEISAVRDKLEDAEIEIEELKRKLE